VRSTSVMFLLPGDCRKSSVTHSSALKAFSRVPRNVSSKSSLLARVRFAAHNGLYSDIALCLKCANSGLKRTGRSFISFLPA
jgi:hypothetical protein